MNREPGPPRSKLKLIIYVFSGLLASAAVAAVIMGGYTPFYRTFLQTPAKEHYAKRVPGITGIDYVARINDGLYRGAYPRESLGQLKKLGIRTIVNFRYLKIHDYREEAEAEGFSYHWIPLHPGEPPTGEQIKKFLDIVSDPANRPVYMHCTLGIDRTGVMAGIYRIEHDGWDNHEAVLEMEHFGHNELWIDIEEFLKRYPASLKDTP
jgi:protein tyrosine phosphatase (PTP) superfamily phosphohydrolase (DUF442 family)